MNNIVSEGDWRTFANAGIKARKLANSPNISKYEAQRRNNQADSFGKYASEVCDKQYGVDKIKKRESDHKTDKSLGKIKDDFRYTNGELKRLDKQSNDVHDFYQGEQEYKNGKWVTKESKKMNMKKEIIRLTESDLHKIIESSVKKCITEMGRFDSDLDADEIYGDRADREYKQSMRDKLFQDEWEMRNRRLRQKYPGKSEEWYEAMIDTFYENKKSRKAINEIGDTPKGNFALNAVRGRAVARPRYHNDKYGSLNDRAKQARIAGDASDKAWDNYTKNPNLGFHNEAGYNYGYSKGMEESCNEESFQNNQNYTHFAVSKRSGKILNGWDYSEYDPSELRQFKKDYFDVDMQDYGFDPKSYKIVTGKYLLRQGVDPDDNSNWANNDEANADWIG